MYTNTEIITIFNNCRSVPEIMKAAKLLKELESDYCQTYRNFVQSRSLIRLNHIYDDGN